jgi:hypothetical protein
VDFSSETMKAEGLGMLKEKACHSEYNKTSFKNNGS